MFLAEGGWLMLPILICSVVAVAIILERFWALRLSRVAPKGLRQDVLKEALVTPLSHMRLLELERHSPLGRLFASGLRNSPFGREIMKDAIEESATAVVHELERFLSLLGTIAAITPLLGLLGTVLGMIEVFAVIMEEGAGQATVLAGGISKALITTAAGLSVGIPALLFHRFFERRVSEMVVRLEQESVHLVEQLHGQRAYDEQDMKVRPSGATPRPGVVQVAAASDPVTHSQHLTQSHDRNQSPQRRGDDQNGDHNGNGVAS